MAVLQGHRRFFVKSVTFDPAGERLLSVDTEKSTIVWDLESAEPLFILEGDGPAAWSPAGGRIATVTGIGIVTIWDAETGEKITEIRMPRGR